MRKVLRCQWNIYTIRDDELMVVHARLLEDFELIEKEHEGLKGELP
jgi:hypothetical protein